MMTSISRILILVLIATLASIAHGDIITLKDGTIIEGVVIKETGAQVVVEITISNIKTTKTYPRYKVKSIERKPIESATGKKESNDKVDTNDSTTRSTPRTTIRSTERSNKSTPRKRTPRVSSTSRDSYIVVPITGKIGEDTNAHGLNETLKLAVRKKIKHIVFTIDSPGGYVYDAVETLKVLKEYDEALIYHALVEGGAISAASVYVAAADDIFVRPDARVGGAVAYTTDNSSGATEVDAKFNSIWSAEIAARAESKGYPAEIFRAMVELDAEVWMDKEGKVTSSKPTGASSAQQIDTRKTILTIRAAQMVQAGMAKEFTGSIDQLGELLDTENWSEIRGLGKRTMINSAKERIDLHEKMVFAQKFYDDTIKDYEMHHPAAFSDYLRYVIIRRDRNLFNRRNRGPENSDVQDAESINLWRERTRDAISDCDIMIEALTEMASVNTSAERIGALHIVMSKEIGNDRYRTLKAAREWLAANMNKIPWNPDGTLQTGPQI